MDIDSLRRARSVLDQANAKDPEQGPDGQPLALVYADAIDRWLDRLVPDPSPALRIAARGQHLERWVIPRDRHPMDRTGYHRWRLAVQARQGARAAELLAGQVDAATVTRISRLVAKVATADDPDGQALEDAACLVFLEQELTGFATKHGDYTPEKYLGILRRTFAKMSPEGRALVGTLPLEEPFADLVRSALLG